MTVSKEERCAHPCCPFLAGSCETAGGRTEHFEDCPNKVRRDLLYAEEIGRLRRALEQIERLFDFEYPIPLQAPSIARLALSPETKTGSSQSQNGCAPKSATSDAEPSGAREP